MLYPNLFLREIESELAVPTISAERLDLIRLFPMSRTKTSSSVDFAISRNT